MDTESVTTDEAMSNRRDLCIEVRRTLLLNDRERVEAAKQLALTGEQCDEVMKRFAAIAEYIESLPAPDLRPTTEQAT